MSQNPETEQGIVPATYLDPKRIGEILLRVIPASAAVGHEFPAGLRDYCHPRDAETEFVMGMLSMSTPELAERWYGGLDYASRIACMSRGLQWPEM